jgi:hypothetical protein
MSAMYGGVRKRKRVGEGKGRLSRDLGEVHRFLAFWAGSCSVIFLWLGVSPPSLVGKSTIA